MRKYGHLLLALLTMALFVVIIPTTALASEDIPIDDTNFPDPVFRQYVLDHIDTNEDSILQQEESDSVVKINCNIKVPEGQYFSDYVEKNKDEGQRIKELTGIENFTNLEKLTFNLHHVTELDVTPFPKLKTISASGNPIKSLDLTSCPNIEHVEMRRCGLETLKLPTMSDEPNVQVLYLDYNKLKQLDLTNLGMLTELKVSNNELESLDIGHIVWLQHVDAHYNNIKKIDVSSADYLFKLNLIGNPIEELNLGEYYTLKSLKLNNYNLPSLDLSKFTKLEELMLNYPKQSLTNDTLILPETDTLKYLYLDHNTDLTSVDLSKYPNLEEFAFNNCRNCDYLDFTQVPKLKWLRLSGVPAWPQPINLTQCPDLEELTIHETGTKSDNYLGKIDLSQNPKLKNLSFYLANIDYIDVSNNPELESITAYGNPIICLDFTNNPKVKPNAELGHFVSDIKLDANGELDLGTLPMGEIFDPSRVSNITNATLDGKVLKVNPEWRVPGSHVYYDYDCGQGISATFWLTISDVETPPTEPEPVEPEPTEPEPVEPQEAIPPTGDPLTNYYVSAGLLLIAGSILLLILYKKRQKA